MTICNGCGGLLGRDCFNHRECEEISRQQEQECKKCDGRGYYADHDIMANHNPADGSCLTCPIQVQCQECQEI